MLQQIYNENPTTAFPPNMATVCHEFFYLKDGIVYRSGSDMSQLYSGAIEHFEDSLAGFVEGCPIIASVVYVAVSDGENIREYPFKIAVDPVYYAPLISQLNVGNAIDNDFIIKYQSASYPREFTKHFYEGRMIVTSIDQNTNTSRGESIRYVLHDRTIGNTVFIE